MSRHVLIIGGTSGLGKQLAILYATEGCQVGVTGRRGNLLQELLQQFPDNIHICQSDITDKDISGKIMELIQAMNGIDILIITASMVELNQEPGHISDTDTISTNVTGFTRIIAATWQYFLTKGKGHIVGVTSIAAARGNKNAPAYHASKSFQSAYLESLRIKAKHDKKGITVTELIPGYMDTAMGKGGRIFWMASVEKAARQSKKAIDGKRARAFITKRWWLAYHVQRLLPAFIYDRLMNGRWKLKQKN
ncbi:MAG: SDR family NAD(P)-dependent oxidoreductase [Chitinophagaceae bacterium]|nr:SDR family NAD(P)-dependent oxidoreductase [Chitinophagaceae bacterium]